MAQKIPKKLELAGFESVSVNDPSLPEQVLAKLRNRDNFWVPYSQEEKYQYWLTIINLVKKYAYGFSQRYTMEVEDLFQEGYCFFEELLAKFQPIYRRPYQVGDEENFKGIYHLIAYDLEDRRYVYKFYQLKPYLFNMLFQKLRWVSQRHWNSASKNSTGFTKTAEFAEEENIQKLNYSSDSQTSSFPGYKTSQESVEGNLLLKWIQSKVTEIALDCSGLKQTVTLLHFKYGLREKEIYTLLGKSQSVVNNNILAVRKQLREVYDQVMDS